VPRIIIDITDELASELLNRRVDAVAVCLTALSAAVKDENMKPQDIDPPAKRPGPGRPPGKTREKRSINLEPAVWAWLEGQALPDESFSDTCNRILKGWINSAK